jgi:hypothetical protein
MKIRGLCFKGALMFGAVCSVALTQWSVPQNVSRLTTGVVAWYPSLTIDSLGTLHASWSHRMSNDCDWIEYSCKPVGIDTWTTPVRVSRDSFVYRESVVLIAPGNVPFVAWMSGAEAGHFYFARKSGDTWTIPLRVETWNSAGSGLRGKADNAGRIHAVWHDLTTPSHIWHAMYVDTNWTTPEPVAAETSHINYVVGPDVACDRQGNAHIAYSDGVHDSTGYVVQTSGGWTAPEYLPNPLADLPIRQRIALDTAGCSHVVWTIGHYVPTYCGQFGDSWGQPEPLDSPGSSLQPAVCVDRWNRVHVFYSDNSTGFIERVRQQGSWEQPVFVDTVAGMGEALASGDRLYLLWNKTDPYYRDVWFASEPLTPPGVEESPGSSPAALRGIEAVATQVGSDLTFSLSRESRVRLDVLDSAGRRIAALDIGLLAKGRHTVNLTRSLSASGVCFCRIIAEGRVSEVKLVKVN